MLEIANLILCQIVIFEKPPNIIAAKYSCFAVSKGYVGTPKLAWCPQPLENRATFEIKGKIREFEKINFRKSQDLKILMKKQN